MLIEKCIEFNGSSQINVMSAEQTQIFPNDLIVKIFNDLLEASRKDDLTATCSLVSQLTSCKLIKTVLDSSKLFQVSKLELSLNQISISPPATLLYTRDVPEIAQKRMLAEPAETQKRIGYLQEKIKNYCKVILLLASSKAYQHEYSLQSPFERVVHAVGFVSDQRRRDMDTFQFSRGNFECDKINVSLLDKAFNEHLCRINIDFSSFSIEGLEGPCESTPVVNGWRTMIPHVPPQNHLLSEPSNREFLENVLNNQEANFCDKDFRLMSRETDEALKMHLLNKYEFPSTELGAYLLIYQYMRGNIEFELELNEYKSICRSSKFTGSEVDSIIEAFYEKPRYKHDDLKFLLNYNIPKKYEVTFRYDGRSWIAETKKICK